MFLLKPGRRIDIDHSFQDLGVRTDSNGCVDIRIMLLPLVDGCGWYACCVVDEVHKGQVGGLSDSADAYVGHLSSGEDLAR